MTRRVLFALVPLTCLALVGCGGGNWGSASGTVTLDGAKLKEGVISFHPVDGGASAYGTVKDGAFGLSTGQEGGLAVGKYKVTVAASSVPQEGTGQQARLLTPFKYSQPDTTDLEAVVKSGSNSFKFELKGP